MVDDSDYHKLLNLHREFSKNIQLDEPLNKYKDALSKIDLGVLLEVLRYSFDSFPFIEDFLALAGAFAQREIGNKSIYNKPPTPEYVVTDQIKSITSQCVNQPLLVSSPQTSCFAPGYTTTFNGKSHVASTDEQLNAEYDNLLALDEKYKGDNADECVFGASADLKKVNSGVLQSVLQYMLNEDWFAEEFLDHAADYVQSVRENSYAVANEVSWNNLSTVNADEFVSVGKVSISDISTETRADRMQTTTNLLDASISFPSNLYQAKADNLESNSCSDASCDDFTNTDNLRDAIDFAKLHSSGVIVFDGGSPLSVMYNSSTKTTSIKKIPDGKYYESWLSENIPTLDKENALSSEDAPDVHITTSSSTNISLKEAHVMLEWPISGAINWKINFGNTLVIDPHIDVSLKENFPRVFTNKILESLDG